MNPVHNNEAVRIRISQLSRGLHEYHFLTDPADLGLEPNFRENVVTDVTIEKTGSQLYLRAAVAASCGAQCDRCVEEFTLGLQTSYALFYVYDDLDAAQYEPESVRVVNHDTAYLDLDIDIREVIAIAIPLKLLCRSDCKGLCPRCGTNWNNAPCACSDDDKNTFTLGSLIENL